MIDTTTIYRVVTSPTEHDYAASNDGTTVEWYGSYKRAALAHGERPITIITRADFDALLSDKFTDRFIEPID